MLDDAGVAAALQAALLHLAPKLDLDLASGGRYPGLYQLMGHRSPEIRSLVSRPLQCPVTGVPACNSPECMIRWWALHVGLQAQTGGPKLPC